MLFAYFGPETFLPVTSAIAGVVGVLLMFGRSSLRFASQAIRGLTRVFAKPATMRAGVPSRPHVKVGSAPRVTSQATSEPKR